MRKKLNRSVFEGVLREAFFKKSPSSKKNMLEVKCYNCKSEMSLHFEGVSYIPIKKPLSLDELVFGLTEGEYNYLCPDCLKELDFNATKREKIIDVFEKLNSLLRK